MAGVWQCLTMANFPGRPWLPQKQQNPHKAGFVIEYLSLRQMVGPVGLEPTTKEL